MKKQTDCPCNSCVELRMLKCIVKTYKLKKCDASFLQKLWRTKIWFQDEAALFKAKIELGELIYKK